MLNSNNEWGKLKEVVVGSATHANWSTTDPGMINLRERTTWKETPVPSGPVPQWIIDEANEDLDELARTLRLLGVTVHRPLEMNFQELNGMYNYCPRDRLLIAGDKVVDGVMEFPCRDMEIQALEFVTSRASSVLKMPRDQGMIFDAANIVRLNDSWLMLESPSGNIKAHAWLQEQFPNINIEVCNFYAGTHIDSTVAPLREGLVLLNGSRVNPDNVPAVFKKWDQLYMNDCVPRDFYEYPYASKWIGLNLLVVDPNTVIVDAIQSHLIQALEANKFTVIPLHLRHSRTLGGGFHCVTLDLVRES